MTQEHVARALLLNSSGEVLLLTRSNDDDRRKGDYDYPGGGIEPGEDILPGLVREIYEETAIRISAEDLRPVLELPSPRSGENITRHLLAVYVGNQSFTLSHEHDFGQWMKPELAVTTFPHHFYSVGLKKAIELGILNELVKSALTAPLTKQPK